MMRLLVAISLSGYPPVVEPSAVLVAFGFAVTIGILSGIYPAWKASQLDPAAFLKSRR